MLVPMRMRLTGRRSGRMGVLVMIVMPMPVFVSNRFVDVVVFVPFGEMQPQAERHEAAGDDQLRG
jgi:hypothetical protein